MYCHTVTNLIHSCFLPQDGAQHKYLRTLQVHCKAVAPHKPWCVIPSRGSTVGSTACYHWRQWLRHKPPCWHFVGGSRGRSRGQSADGAPAVRGPVPPHWSAHLRNAGRKEADTVPTSGIEHRTQGLLGNGKSNTINLRVKEQLPTPCTFVVWLYCWIFWFLLKMPLWIFHSLYFNLATINHLN